jgi:PAS domain S-box-containing protein
MPVNKKKGPKSLSSLKNRAKSRLNRQTGKLEDITKYDVKLLIEALGTYQIELEIQNEDLRKAQEELEVSRRKYYELYDFAPVGYFTFNKNGLVLDVNLTGASMLNMQKTHLKQKPFLLFIDENDREIFHSHCKEVLKTDSKLICELMLIKKGNMPFFAELQSIAVEIPEDGTKMIRSIMTDITERRDIENKLNAAKKEAESANVIKSNFLSNMGHELRTPLNAILGYAQIMQRDKALTESNKNNIGIINRSAENLLQMINNLLDLSKIEAGRVEHIIRTFDLRQFLSSIIELIKLQADEKGLQIILDVESDLPGVINGDDVSLGQVLLNLLSNAVKFSDSGSIILKISGQKASLKDSKTFNIRFEVIDSGVGMRPDELEEIFRPFIQLAENKSQTKGTGLGLTISRQLVRMMGGELLVKSKPGEGSVFWFSIDFDYEDDKSILKKSVSTYPVLENTGKIQDNLVPPSLEELQALFNMANSGDITNLRKWADVQLASENKKLHPFSARLKQLAKGIRFSEIKALLSRYLKK